MPDGSPDNGSIRLLSQLIAGSTAQHIVSINMSVHFSIRLIGSIFALHIWERW